MSVIDDLRTYLLTYSGLASGAFFLIDTLDKEPTSYALVPIPGARVLETNIDDSTVKTYPFALQSKEATDSDEERKSVHEFYEALAAWFDTQTKAGALPSLDTGKTATKIEASGWGFILEYDESGTGIYQIQAVLTYDEVAP